LTMSEQKPDGKQIAEWIYDKDKFDQKFKRSAMEFEDMDEKIEANKKYRIEEKPMEVSYETQMKVLDRLIEKAEPKQTSYLQEIRKTVKAQKTACDLSRGTYKVFYAYRNQN